MQLREFVAEDAINLDLQSTVKDDVLKELVGLLKLDEKADALLVKMLKRRETLGSTGIGQNIAIPHCRSLVPTTCGWLRPQARGVDFAPSTEARPLLLPDRRPAARGLEPVSPRARQDRPVRQGAGYCRAAREVEDAARVLDATRREEHLAQGRCTTARRHDGRLPGTMRCTTVRRQVARTGPTDATVPSSSEAGRIPYARNWRGLCADPRARTRTSILELLRSQVSLPIRATNPGQYRGSDETASGRFCSPPLRY